MKLIFELPDNILTDTEIDRLPFISTNMKQMVSREVRDQLVTEYMKRASFTDLGITKEEVKQAVIDKLASRALRKLNEEEVII